MNVIFFCVHIFFTAVFFTACSLKLSHSLQPSKLSLVKAIFFQ